MESQVTFSGHLILCCSPQWGHLRPLCALATKLVQVRHDVVVTLLIAGEYGKQSEKEINKYFSTSEADSRAKGNIRIVNICKERLPNLLAQLPLMSRDFPPYYDKLVNCEPVQCLETGKTFDGVRKPTAVVLDFFLPTAFQYIRSVTGKSVPMFNWMTSSVAAALQFLGPEELGGVGDVTSKARIQADATGRNFEDVLEELCHPVDGNVVRVPGLPPMYDYEYSPQEFSQYPMMGKLFTVGYTVARECDGFVFATGASYEPESVEAFRAWLGETNRPLYTVGPLVPPGSWDVTLSDKLKQLEIDLSKDGEEIQAFLDKILKSHGERSLLYISFGTGWYPSTLEHVWALMDVLLENHFPFILSHPSEKVVIPPEYVEKIKQSGIGFLSKWCPQLTILNHPVTGLFLTHCGQNSVTEALVQGKPLIVWPFSVDQPASAAHLTSNLDVAFHLVEVRTGHGLRPLYGGAKPTGTIEAIKDEARSILQRARGPEGERKRRNAELMSGKWKREWEEGGDSLSNLKKLLADTCSQS